MIRALKITADKMAEIMECRPRMSAPWSPARGRSWVGGNFHPRGSRVAASRGDTRAAGSTEVYPLSRENTTMPLAGMTMLAELGKPCRAGPFAVMLPPLPAAIGLTQLS